jgi:uncharacterized membrane protein
MLVWAAIIAALTGIGFLTAMVGFVVIMPWLGYASWHGYRDSLDVGIWNELPVRNA